jgi:hypothetical protein
MIVVKLNDISVVDKAVCSRHGKTWVVLTIFHALSKMVALMVQC